MLVNESNGSISRQLLFSGLGRGLVPRVLKLVRILEQKTGIRLVSFAVDGVETSVDI